MVILNVIFNAVIIIGVFSVLIIVHELGHFIAARMVGVRVERFALGFGKKLFGIKKGNTEYRINLIPFGGYVKLAGDDPYERKGKEYEFYSKPARSRLWILVSGSLYNYIFAFLILIALYLLGTPTLTSKIGGVLEGSPAQSVGIKTGDKIVSIDRREVKYWKEVLEIIKADKEALPLDFGIERKEKLINITVVPSVITTKDVFKREVKFVGVGIAPAEDVVILQGNPGKALVLAAQHVWFFTTTTYKGIWLLVTGAMPVKGNVGGPVRIIEVLSKAIKYGPLSVLNIMAIISLALAIFNMLPFPVLDGGHIFFLAIEKVRGKPLSIRAQEILTQTALVLLIAFVLYVSYFDTVRVITDLRK